MTTTTLTKTTTLADRVREFKPTVYKCKYNWDEVVAKLRSYCRNSQVTAIAPTTSTSILMGSTSSFLPVYQKYFVDKNSKGNLTMIPAYYSDKFWHYTENKNIDQRFIVELVGENIQPWIDSGVSMELLHNLNNVTAVDMFDTIIRAWESCCKTIYYVRSIEKDSEVSQKEECVSCSG